MRRSVIKATALTLVAGLVLGGGAAWAVTDAEINAGVQFNFATPGARSLGLAGAFTGVADDATAAFTNPAGLMILSKPEISLEAKFSDFTTEYTDRGHAFGGATGVGVDTEDGLFIEEADSDTVGAAFISFVYPRKRWAVAAYRHELANFETEITTQGAFFDVAGASFRLFPVMADMDLQISNYGVSGAFRVSNNLSIGAGVSAYDFEIDSTTQRFGLTVFEEVPNFSPANVQNIQTQDGDDTDVAFNVGLQWKFLPKWNLGLAFREGAEFDYTAANTFGPASGTPGVPIASNTATFSVPDVAGLGVSFRPWDALLISFDYDRVEYSALTDDVTSNFFDQGTLTPVELTALGKLEVEDGDEFRLGAEYVFLGKTPVAIRVGTWLDPDHKISFDGAPADILEEKSLAVLFFEGDDEVHVSAGVGLVIGKRFQIDAAIDVSNLINIASVSGVFRF